MHVLDVARLFSACLLFSVSASLCLSVSLSVPESPRESQGVPERDPEIVPESPRASQKGFVAHTLVDVSERFIFLTEI